MKILIENAWILTMDDNAGEIHNGWLLTDGEKIAALGKGEAPKDWDERIDARDGILLPGFVNLHCHASMIPFRGMGDDCPDRLQKLFFPLENKAMTEKLAVLSTKYAMAEMLLSGCTTFTDMYYFEDSFAPVCAEMGMLGYLGETVLTGKTCDAPDAEAGLKRTEKMLKELSVSSWARPVIAPHGTTTCSAELLKKCAELSYQYQAILTLHVAESDSETEYFAARGTTPVEWLNKNGLVTDRLLAVHCINLSDNDLDILSQGRSSVAHCIGSNVKGGRGVAPVQKMLNRGIPVGFGTDGPASGNTLSMFDQMRLFACAHKTALHDRMAFPAKRIVQMATRDGAMALHAGSEFGRLLPGMRADMVLVSLDSAHMFPAYNPYSALVYSANSSDVDTVITGGKVRVRHGTLCSVDLTELRVQLNQEMAPFLRASIEFSDII